MIITINWLFKYILKGYAGITLFPFIFVKSGVSKTLIKHEQVHIKQQKKYFIIGFYIRYMFEYIANLVKYKNHKLAYYTISFEKDAYCQAQGKKYYNKMLEIAMT